AVIASQFFRAGKAINQGDTSTTVNVTQTLFDGYPAGKQSAAVDKARLQLELQRLVLADALNNARYAVRAAYANLRGAKRTVEAKDAGYQKFRDELERVQSLRTARMATELDVSQAQTAAESGRLDLVLAQSEVTTARGRLAVLLGRDWNSDFDVAPAT